VLMLHVYDRQQIKLRQSDSADICFLKDKHNEGL